MAGDESGAWKVVEAALSSGLDPDEIYQDVVGPAMHEIGEGWVHGTTSIAAEHRATAAREGAEVKDVKVKALSEMVEKLQRKCNGLVHSEQEKTLAL